MQLAKSYDPNKYEPNIYAMWETSGAFSPRTTGEPYAIVMPPPNANGNLHVGHALMVEVEDILVRYHRMKGKSVVYLPGADHAGFETWVVYERALREKGQSRFDFSREQLYSQVWNFVDEQRGNMELQLRALGASADWSNLTFTLDKKVIDTVYSTFKRMWDEGLVYRGERIVNYSTAYQTSYADIEVEHKTEKGTLWKIAYPVVDKVGEVVVATTRPETLLGDTAVAVHPDDERYKHLIGTSVQLPLTDREIPVIADEYVDPNFGTGVVKITPAHDPNDFEMGNRHDLKRIQVIGFDGKMTHEAGNYAGLEVEDARKKILAALQALELRRGEDTIEHSVGYDYKSGLPIQPLIKDQWFVNVKPLADRAIAAIEAGDITFYPESRKSAVLQYYRNLKDWNISRQIPWGIPIPAFVNKQDPEDWIFDTRVEDKEIVVNETTYVREEDTFDTWFSSAQWPFITTGALTDSDLAKFYPTSVLETGHDILYPWVARMIMLGLYATDKVPFKDVYLHGLVLDEHGQKMSKSKGNVLNPMQILAEYGSDALRFGLISSRSAGQNQAFSVSKVIAGRNFCNKLWNISRFILDKLGEDYTPGEATTKSLADDWIVGRLAETSRNIEKQLEAYRFAEASEAMYHAIWDDVADWYIESSKVENNPDMLAWVLETALRLAHPFAPFVTETIWQTLPWTDSVLILEHWPRAIEYDRIAAGEYTRLQALVTEARYVVSELPGNKRYPLLFQKDTLIEENAALIKQLARVSEVTPVDQARGLRLAASGREAWLDIDEDTLYEHQTNLEVRLAETRQKKKTLEARLANENYIAKAPEHLVDETRSELEATDLLIEQLARELDILR
ncbi:MAG: Valyl-tRNA synthetase [Candidatus Saccharibacteria bacterium GW2011_GWC2_48_9]|nr:MAG: Valyl-tRNA synthetase [Candidatus Saccharibacteria bacterium GW2011_GWC2_48_9]